jgi:hypothetical protein
MTIPRRFWSDRRGRWLRLALMDEYVASFGTVPRPESKAFTPCDHGVLAFGPDTDTTVSPVVALEEAAEAELRAAVLRGGWPRRPGLTMRTLLTHESRTPCPAFHHGSGLDKRLRFMTDLVAPLRIGKDSTINHVMSGVNRRRSRSGPSSSRRPRSWTTTSCGGTSAPCPGGADRHLQRSTTRRCSSSGSTKTC